MTKIVRRVAHRATGSLLLAATALLGAVCLPMSAAKAATVTELYNFTASGFTASGSPVDPWTGSFTITFDPTGGTQAGALGAFSSNLPAGYGTFTFLAFPGELVVGDDCNIGGCSATAGADNAFVDFHVTASGGLTFNLAAISSTSSTSSLFETSTGTVSQTPLPAALPLFASGLGAMGLFGWRRKRKTQAVAA